MGDDQRQLEHSVHWTLLAGLAASAVLLVAGILLTLMQGPQTSPPHESLGELLRRSAQLQGQSVTTVGLLVLMITPILRVVVLLVGWTKRRDWIFAAVALAVLALLAVSLMIGVG